jgi:hypothetical protein
MDMAGFTSRPILHSISEIPQSYRDRASSAAYSQYRTLQVSGNPLSPHPPTPKLADVPLHIHRTWTIGPQIIIIHLLGLAPAGYLTAPDNGALRRLRGSARKGDGCHAVPLNLLNRCDKRTSAEEKDYDSGLGEGGDLPHTYPVNPEPTTPRKRPALLARVLGF